MIAEEGLLPVAFLLYAFLAYGLIALLFVSIQHDLPWTKTKKGLAYGLILGLLWAIYLLEPLPYNLNYSLASILLFPFADGIAIVFLGVLSGRFLASDSPGWGKQSAEKWTLTLFSVTVFFLIGRLLDYTVFNIFSAYSIKPLDTLAWVAATGFWGAITYLVLSSRITLRSAVKRTAYFGLLIFGLNLIVFNGFLALAVEVDLIDLFVRTAVDISFVALGVFIAEVIWNSLSSDS
jgi:hypothetical protein